MMKKAKVFLCSLLVLCAVFFCMTALAAEDIVFTFENDASLAGWSTSYLRYNFDPGCFFGYAFEKSANLSDPMFISPILDINAEDYRYVVVNMRFSIDAAWSRTGTVFFLVPDGTWNGNMAVGSERYANGTLAAPTNVVFDMAQNKDWKGTIKQIRLDPFEAPGTIELYSITLTNTRPADDSAKDAQENTPKKEIGVFLTPNTYAENFSDVPETEWYASEIESAYELGFVNGKADTLFAPEDGMTIAEAITLAARTNNAYGSGDYGFTAADGEEWYMPYVKYAVENKIIDPQDYTDYNASATRGQMAKIFANALPASEYAAVNSVGRIPDVAQSSPYYAAVLKLFNAGIVMGNDAYGTFYPESGIKRCEAAAIINRIAFKDKRIKKNLLTTVPALNNDAFTMSSEAKCFIDDKVFRHQHMDGVPGGWDAVRVLTAPEKFSRASYVLVDNSDQYEAYYTRKFMPVSDGVLDLDFGVNIYGNNGAYLLFADENGKPVMEILLDHGIYTVLSPDGSYTDTGAVYTSNAVYFDIRVNLDNKTFDFGLDGNDTKPIQSTAMNQAIIDGYFNARYSDKLKFAIMWENSSVNGLSFEDFKKYTVPYWMEYFFKDERYVKIDNKPLLTVWQLDNKFKDVSAKEAFDYVREECRKAGFDGCEILLYSGNSDPAFEESMKANGIDGLLAYHWGTDGSNAVAQEKHLTAYSALDYTVPTISVGFDYVGWGRSERRNGLLDPKDYPTMTEIVKKALAERQKTGGKYANMVNISTWNEYGEGTYVMPTERFGFGYLDAIRAAFTKTGTAIHSDLTLSASQRQRINYLFGQDRQLLRPQMLAEKQQTDEENKTFTVDISGSELALIKEPDRTNGGLMVPVYPESGIFSRMMCTYTWNKRTQTLTVSNAKHTVSFVIGKDTMTVDGSEKKLYAATYWYDGLPVLPLDTLAASLGYFPVTHEDGSGVSIMLGSASDYDILKKRKPYQYEFALLGDTEDWTPQNSTISVEGGVLKGISTGNDPAVISPGLSVKAETYPTIAIRMKWDRNNTDKKDLAVIYFRKANAGLSEFRTVAIKDLPTSSNGEFVEFKFNMQEHLQWDGEITGIRFDPFNATGTFEIDYIRFEKAEGAEEAEKAAAEREANLDDTIANGDASMQMYNPMYSVNANVTIVKALNGDPCYNVKTNGAGKVWTYCIQKVKFTPGATYRVEFDARMTGTSTGEFTAGLETGIFVNFMYDGSDKRDHPQNIGVLRMSDKDEWQHFSAELTVEKSCDNVNDEFSVFTNPIGNAGVNYQLDNITMTRIDE